jgi:hypothetical protein
MDTFRAWKRTNPLVASAVVAVALVTAGTAEAAAPPTLPEGYVQLIDDTGTITVTVPDAWTDVDTVPTADATGVVPYISASPDFASFLDSFAVPGVVYSALPYTDDLQSLIDDFGLPSGCAKLSIEPYDDGVFVGLAQLGTSCGTAGTASWVMVAANPADQAFTAVVQVQSATAADEQAIDVVLQSFNRTGPAAAPGSTLPSPSTSSAPASNVPGASVPTGLGPVEVATLFLDSLAAGDGATACALLTVEEMTINFVEEAATCAPELSLQVAGQGDFWAGVEITGDENTSSPGQCGDEDPADEYVSLELQGPTDDGCLSISIDNGEWRVEDLSNSIWNQADG